VAATATTAVLAVVLTFAPPQLPWNRVMHLRIEAGSFGDMNKDAGVELGGIKIGKVTRLDYRGGKAIIDVQVDQRYASQLHQDAGAEVRPHGLLGPKYVDLNPGRSGRMREGATIPLSRVRVSTDVDQVINALQPDVRQNLQTFFVEFGTASDGRGGDVNAAFQALGDATQDYVTTTATIRHRDVELANFFVYSEELNRDVQYAPISANLRDTDQVLSGLVQVENSIGGTVDHTAGLARKLDTVLNGNSGNLALVLQKAPKTLNELRTAVVAADGFVQGSQDSIPYLMTAVVETKSAFSGRDADGHYVRVMAVTGPCSVAPGPGVCSSPHGYDGPRGGAAASPQSSSQPSQPGASDQELTKLFRGNQ